MIKDKLYSTYLDAICDKVDERPVELSGIPPLSFTAKGKPLTAWSITGNTVQNGTPTPDNPVEVLGCGDYDSDTGMYKIPVATRGKNLFKAPVYTSKTENGVTWESNGDGTITVRGIASGYSTFMLSNKYPIPSNCIGQNLTFDYRISKVSNIIWDVIIFYDENNTEVVRYALGAKDAVTIKIEPNFKKVTASIKRGNNYETIGTVGLMIELGTEATEYEPYHEPITTSIYIPTPLYSGEVMRSDGTITRSDGTTETFTAPQIPTINGTTVIDVDTAVKPESMTIKYKGV